MRDPRPLDDNRNQGELVNRHTQRDRQVATDRHAVVAAERFTRRLARSHYENFLVATVLLPRRLKQPFYNVYAFCRMADDLADESPDPQIALDGLADFQSRLDALYGGSSDLAYSASGDGDAQSRTEKPGNGTADAENVFLALAKTVRQFRLPREPFDDLLDAFRQDQVKNRYANMDELLAYCRRSANPVGRIVLRLGECYDEKRAALSDDLCTGLQLANFWQDVRRDFAIGRVYLPFDRMQHFGVEESMLDQTSTPQPLRELLSDQCDLAEDYLNRGSELVRKVPNWIASDIQLFAAGGLETINAIRRVEYDVLRTRPVVSKWRQAWMVVKAAAGVH